MYEFCINYARTLWNVDKDLLDLLIYAGICWSASTSTCLYLFVSFGVCAFSSQLWNRAQRSGARPLFNHCFPVVGASVAKQNEAALNDGKRNEVQRNVVDRCVNVVSRREVRNRGGVWGGVGTKLPPNVGWRMTGSA